ncbi:hypothetical protein JCGZ_01148 [Jatropha curcas]|uniref:Aminotransferase-like plant mobile domain-containing protein n=1 Tax=Jatropha curcas TaxID=180498 RepID=A0A067JJU8_JATCU|nr:hypothetical protein JCGZ_01148 [Jatropha curcas]
METLPMVQGQTLPSSILALMQRWMDTIHTFHLPFSEMIVTSIHFAPITGLLFAVQSVVFDDRMRTLDHPGQRASLRAAIGIEPTISDQRFKYESIYSYYQEIPREQVVEIDVDVVLERIYSICCRPLHSRTKDLDATRQFNWGAAAICYSYYGMDLYVRGAHSKVGYKWAIEEVFSYNLGHRDVLTIAEWLELGSAAIAYQHRQLLLQGRFYNMYYLGERVYEWKLGSDQRRVPHDVPYYMLSTRSIQLAQDTFTSGRGSATTDHLVAFMPGTYAVFMQT